MQTVQKILKAKKGQGFIAIAPDATAYEALQLMADKDIGALLIVKDEKIAGIFTERDYARKVILKGKASKETPVSELMTKNVYCVTPEHTIEQCESLMDEKHLRHLPVVEGDKPIGLLSIRDVVNMIISERENKIKELEGYITGTNYVQED